MGYPSYDLTFDQFAKTNKRRCEAADGFNHKLESWSLSDWFTAFAGEVGEAGNVIKKLNRIRDGVPGNTLSEEDLKKQLIKELGDAGSYLDLLCQVAGTTMEECMREAFNSVSVRMNSKLRV